MKKNIFDIVAIPSGEVIDIDSYVMRVLYEGGYIDYDDQLEIFYFFDKEKEKIKDIILTNKLMTNL